MCSALLPVIAVNDRRTSPLETWLLPFSERSPDTCGMHEQSVRTAACARNHCIPEVDIGKIRCPDVETASVTPSSRKPAAGCVGAHHTVGWLLTSTPCESTRWGR